MERYFPNYTFSKIVFSGDVMPLTLEQLLITQKFLFSSAFFFCLPLCLFYLNQCFSILVQVGFNSNHYYQLFFLSHQQTKPSMSQLWYDIEPSVFPHFEFWLLYNGQYVKNIIQNNGNISMFQFRTITNVNAILINISQNTEEASNKTDKESFHN